MPEEAPELEKQSCDSAKSESETNIAGITKATVAIEKGMGDSFLQSSFAFLPLCGSADYAPASGESTGMLKTMGDEMKVDLNDTMAKEGEAVAGATTIQKTAPRLVHGPGGDLDTPFLKEKMLLLLFLCFVL